MKKTKNLARDRAVLAEYVSGTHPSEIARTYAVSTSYIYRLARCNGVRHVRRAPLPFIQKSYQPLGKDATERAAIFATRYLGGETMEEIGKGAGLSRERVRQILTKAGITGGSHRTMAGEVPFDPAEFHRRSSPSRLIRNEYGRRDVLHKWATWRRDAIGELRALAERLGHTPTLCEVAAHYGLRTDNTGWIVNELGPRWCGRTTSTKGKTIGIHRWYRLAGLKVRGRGWQVDRAYSNRA